MTQKPVLRGKVGALRILPERERKRGRERGCWAWCYEASHLRLQGSGHLGLSPQVVTSRPQYLRPQSSVDLSASDLKVLSTSVPQTSKFCRPQYLRPQSSVDLSTSDLKVPSTSVPQTSKFCRLQYLKPQSSACGPPKPAPAPALGAPEDGAFDAAAAAAATAAAANAASP